MVSNAIGFPASIAKKTFIPDYKYKTGVYQRDYYLYYHNTWSYRADEKLYIEDGFSIPSLDINIA